MVNNVCLINIKKWVVFIFIFQYFYLFFKKRIFVVIPVSNEQCCRADSVCNNQLYLIYSSCQGGISQIHADTHTAEDFWKHLFLREQKWTHILILYHIHDYHVLVIDITNRVIVVIYATFMTIMPWLSTSQLLLVLLWFLYLLADTMSWLSTYQLLINTGKVIISLQSVDVGILAWVRSNFGLLSVLSWEFGCNEWCTVWRPNGTFYHTVSPCWVLAREHERMCFYNRSYRPPVGSTGTLFCDIDTERISANSFRGICVCRTAWVTSRRSRWCKYCTHRRFLERPMRLRPLTQATPDSWEEPWFGGVWVSLL